MKNTDRIKLHFEQEANEYDDIIKRLIPFYQEMVDALVSAIVVKKDVTILLSIWE